MGKEILTFGNFDIEKNEFCRPKTIFLKDVDIEKVLVSNKISFGKKKNVSTLLVTSIIMIKLGNYI